MSNSTNTLLGIITGTAIGAAVGILFAPDSGVNTRRKIKTQAIDAKDSLAETAIDLRNQVAETASVKKENLDSQLESIVTNVSYKADDVISTLEKKLSELKVKNKKLQKS
ncbi:YtxH domain-containing protein [Aurantibacter crassamenti]|uniref:YtxH domain-containing protein n=1 Tax=Aurantibacter crassamenti TaxID=1837375 RepID=UPI00193A2AAC|nr:YtxH domain-containing protein [Aurantibacter crassamenti]MBM1107710.1 YtxH domain-containing protein [Aurantibacter crassamenti]